MGNHIGVICGKGRLGQREVGKCSVINFKTKKVYEDVVVYDFNNDYNAVIIDTGDSVVFINTILGTSVSLSGKLNKVYRENKHKSRKMIIKLENGITYSMDIGCNVNIYKHKGEAICTS